MLSKMHHKLSTAGFVIAVLAAFAAVPAVASASPVLNYAAGGAVAPGASIAAGSTNLVLTGGSATMSCTNNHLNGSVVTNNGSNVEAEISSATFAGSGAEGRCATNRSGQTIKWTSEGLPWCLQSSVLGEAAVRGGGCGASATAIKFDWAVYSFGFLVGHCTYELTGNSGQLLTHYASNTSPLVLTLATGTQLTRKSCTNHNLELELAPTWEMTGSFTTSANGQAVEIS